MNTLIVYTTKHGCVSKCADILATKLSGNTDIVNLESKHEIDLDQYDNVIIGGSIYVGKIQKRNTEFCVEFLSTLQEKNVGLFICGMNTSDIDSEINNNFPSELLANSKIKEYFGGEFVFSKMNFIEKMVVKNVSKVSSDVSTINVDSIHRFAEIMNTI